MDGAGISALGPIVGLGALPDPLGAATAALEARRRQQVEGAGYDPDKGLYDRYSEMLGTVLGPTIAERSRAAADAMRRGDMATYQKLATDLSMDFGSFLGSIKPIRAYHGSPHDFDKFSMDKIGSGEGNQTYGHGLYFAENEAVARSYRDALAKSDGSRVRPDSEAISKFSSQWDEVNRLLRETDIHRMSYADRKKWYGAPDGPDNPITRHVEYMQRKQDLHDAMVRDTIARNPHLTTGRMYEVNIHADPERFLDWDALADEQPKGVADALSKTSWWPWTRDRIEARGAAHGSNPVGQHIIRDLADDYFPDEISALLNEAGIPGIKYLDAGSRAAGDGSRNYVVFDDKLIEILRKYGIMAPMAGMAGAGVGSLYMDGEREGM